MRWLGQVNDRETKYLEDDRYVSLLFRCIIENRISAEREVWLDYFIEILILGERADSFDALTL